MQHGRGHQERDQKNATRKAEQLRRDEQVEGAKFSRQARSAHPAPTAKAAEEERERHEAEGTIGGNTEPPSD
jgi:hypothetical protein